MWGEQEARNWKCDLFNWHVLLCCCLQRFKSCDVSRNLLDAFKAGDTSLRRVSWASKREPWRDALKQLTESPRPVLPARAKERLGKGCDCSTLAGGLRSKRKPTSLGLGPSSRNNQMLQDCGNWCGCNHFCGELLPHPSEDLVQVL